MILVIVDYGMGNLRSVAKAFEEIGCKTAVSQKPQDILDAGAVVLPGVGAFGDGMANLKRLGLIAALRTKVLDRKAPFLGICLGMQLLAERGTEEGLHEGLGWIAGEVRKLEPKDSALKVPHMGWNDVTMAKQNPLAKGLGETSCFYFLHSYHLVCADPQDAIATCDYGGRFTAAIGRGNIFGTQFHPEKSQKHGLELLRNFALLGAA